MSLHSVIIFLGVSLGVAVIAIIGLLAYVRLSPTSAARWHTDPASAYTWGRNDWNTVIPVTGGAVLRLPASPDILARLDAIAMATPRTTRLVGTAAQGQITWVTRSAFWGFPDYTTAQIKADGLYIFARLRFGKSDLGVNAARLRAWQTNL